LVQDLGKKYFNDILASILLLNSKKHSGFIETRVQIRSAILINKVKGPDAIASEPLDRQVKEHGCNSDMPLRSETICAEKK